VFQYSILLFGSLFVVFWLLLCVAYSAVCLLCCLAERNNSPCNSPCVASPLGNSPKEA